MWQPAENIACTPVKRCYVQGMEIVGTATDTKGHTFRVKLVEEPKWSEFHGRFYAPGFRWIKSKAKFSSVCLLHNFVKLERE